LPDQQFALYFERDQKKEYGRQSIVDPQQRWLIDRKIAKGDRDRKFK